MAVDERTAIAQLQRGEIRGLDALMLIYQVRALRAAFVITRDLRAGRGHCAVGIHPRLRANRTTRYHPALRSLVPAQCRQQRHSRPPRDEDDLNTLDMSNDRDPFPYRRHRCRQFEARPGGADPRLQRPTTNSGRRSTNCLPHSVQRRSCVSIWNCPRLRRPSSLESHWGPSSHESTRPGHG